MERLSRIRSSIRANPRLSRIRSYLPPLNFITVHYTYFILVSLISSLIFWGTSRPDKSISYTDSLFLTISAMTEAGLNTINLSSMTLFQQIVLWLLIQMGSSILVSCSTVLIRKRVFERRFEGIVRRTRRESKTRRGSKTRRRSLSWGRSDETRINNVDRRDRSVGLDDLGSAVDGPGEYHLGLGKLAPVKPHEVSKAEDKPVEIQDTKTLEKAELSNEEPQPALQKFISSDSRDHIAFATPSSHPRMLNFVGVGAHPNPASAYRSRSRDSTFTSNLTHRTSRSLLPSALEIDDGGRLDHAQYPSYLTRHTTGRNAQFHGLTRAERDHLGGVEYRAISLLAWVVPMYFVLWQLLAGIGLGAYMAMNRPSVAYANGINPWWLGIFNAVSAFNNSGMSLLDANMIPFQNSIYTLVTMGLLILAGNTAYPLFLRLILWTMLKLLTFIFPSPSRYTQHKATLRFILTYPRRVYTNLFPATASLWLLFVLILLNGIDWVAFELLNLHNPATQSIPANYRVLDGLFQALAVRSGGFYVIAITQLRIGLQVLYVIMMYISVYPVVITMRHSNVYEERSLGIYPEDVASSPKSTDSPANGTTNDNDIESRLPKLGTLRGRFARSISKTVNKPPFSRQPTVAKGEEQEPRREFVRQQIHGQLAHDLWWLVLAILAISCIEGSNFERDPTTFSVFNIIFEVVSGYGCVGISTGLPDQAYSFSGAWHKSSKLILCAVMLRGRHRGLPVALDRAVRLPDERAWLEEAEEERRAALE